MQVKKTAFDKSSGKILFTIEGDENTIVTDADPAIGYVNGEYDKELFEVVDGSVVARLATLISDEKQAKALEELRRLRNVRLQKCDWTQVSDAPVDQAAWAAYRQSLRDLPQNTADPENPTWPLPPTQ